MRCRTGASFSQTPLTGRIPNGLSRWCDNRTAYRAGRPIQILIARESSMTEGSQNEYQENGYDPEVRRHAAGWARSGR